MASKLKDRPPRNDFEVLRNQIGWSNRHIAQEIGATAAIVDRWSAKGTAPEPVMRWLQGVAAFREGLPGAHGLEGAPQEKARRFAFSYC